MSASCFRHMGCKHEKKEGTKDDVTMKKFYMIPILLAGSGLCLANVESSVTKHNASTAEKPSSSILDDIDLFGDDYGDESTPIPNDALTKALTDFHKEVYKKARFQFFVEQAFLYARVQNAAPGSASSQSWYKLHAHGGIQLVESDRHQGTWIKAELSGSTALNTHTRRTTLDDSWGATGPADCDVFEDGYFYMPEILMSQGVMDGRLVVMGGMVNQTNYFDINAYANTTFGQFGGAPFVNNQVLPLGDSNFGFVTQYQFNDNWFVQLGGNMMDNEPRRNPFHQTQGDSFNFLGEIGWTHEKAFGIGTGTYRLQPFMFHENGKNHGGIAFNLEQDLGSSPFALFSRAGWSSAESGNYCGVGAQVSAGVIFKKALEVITGMKEADGNFLGVGFSVSKPDADTMEESRSRHDREMILECTYTFSITPYCLLQPSYQYVKNPVGRYDSDSANVLSVQCVVTF